MRPKLPVATCACLGASALRTLPMQQGRESQVANETYNVIVVGAASGIGAAATRHLAEQGVRVFGLDRNAAGMTELAETLQREDFDVEAGFADITDPASVRDAIAGVAAKAGQVHGLVNCAGITGKTNIKAHEVELENFDLVYAINLRGALLVTQEVLKHMLPHGYGRILHVASIAGKEGNAGMTAYSATKAGLIGLVKSMAKDYPETGITINALAPAVIRTPMVDALPDATVKYMTDKIPMRRVGELAEASQLIAWIVSPACSFTTGFTFDLTGGRATY
jgi:NAD(P)-dependent dehydrogenase (short-subunit alcohol dehydrogenase family)